MKSIGIHVLRYDQKNIVRKHKVYFFLQQKEVELQGIKCIY